MLSAQVVGYGGSAASAEASWMGDSWLYCAAAAGLPSGAILLCLVQVFIV